MAAGYGGREARLLEAGVALALDRELPAVLRRVVALAAELTGAGWSALRMLGANNAVVDVIATGPRPGQVGLPEPGPGVLRIPVKVHDTAFGDLYVTGRPEGADFDEGDRRTLETLAAYAGVAIENASLIHEAQGRARRLHALREVAAKLLSGSPLDDVLELITSHAMRLAKAASSSAVLPGAREGTLVIEAVAGQPSELRGLELPIDQSVAGRIIQTGKTEIVANLAGDPRAFRPAATLGEGAGPAMFVPLRADGEPFGTLVVVRNQGEPGFGEADAELVEGFADLAAVAYEYAKVHSELRRLAVMEERERIARELHDGAIQALFAVGMGLQATAARTGEPEVSGRLHAAVGELDRVISDLRSYIFGLRPGVLAGRHVDQALRRLVEDIAAPAGVTAVVEVQEQVAAALGPHAGELVQLVREALSNIVRHSGATTCRVSLYSRQDAAGVPAGRVAVLEVDDDGGGFDPQAPHAGHGLDNLRARAGALGGSLELKSVSGDGTTVRVTIPL
jgi:two-component system, NarL family, sensor histidine kinase DevS